MGGLKFSEKTKLRAKLILLFLLGTFMAAFPWDNVVALPDHPRITEFLSRILLGMGEALAIAAVIAVAVDETAKRKVLKEFAEDISTHIVGRLLPPPLREHIHQYLTVDFVRYNWEITYILEIVEGHPEFVRLTTRTVYEMENRSPFPRVYEVEYEVEESWVPEIGATSITFLKVRDLREEKDLYELRKGNANLKTKNEEGYLKLNLDKAITVPLAAYDPSVQHRCRIELASEEYFRDSFVVSFETFHPVLRTTLTVLYPQDKLKLALYLSFDTNDAASEEPIDGGKKWTINRPILAGQGFNVRWNPIPATADATISQANAAKAAAAGSSRTRTGV